MPNPYLATKISTASPEQILLMLYDGAIRFNQNARDLLAGGRSLQALEPMGRTLAIVQELQASLSPKKAPDLCANLDRLYLYMQDQILKAQAAKDPLPLREVGRILKQLRDTWDEAINMKASANRSRRTA